MTKSKNYFTFTKRSIKILAIFTLLACGPGMADYDEFMSFFMPESSNATAENQKYHYTPMFFYNEMESEYSLDEVKEETPPLTLSEVENIEGWMKYCQGKLSFQDIREGIYLSIKGSILESYLKNHKNQLAIDYLYFVQELEQKDAMLVDTEKDTKPLDYLSYDVEILTQLFRRVKNDFMKERIVFQMVKTLSKAKKHQEAINYFNNYLLPIKNKSFISDWALMRKAESEIALGDSAEAYYDFSRVFQKSKSHRNQADILVRYRIGGFPEEAIKFCKNDHEKASLYAFAGIKPGVDALPMLEKMVELDPKNQMIELIMAREINKNEKFYYDQSNQRNYYPADDSTIVKKTQEKASDYWSQLKEFSSKCADNQALTKTGFWQTASAYMEYVQGDFAKSEEFLTKAKAITTTNEWLKNQILLQELLLISKKSVTITPAIESEFLPILNHFAKPKDFRISNAVLESCKILSAKYRGVKELEKTESKGGLSSCSNKKAENQDYANVPHAIAKAYLLTMLTTYQNNSSQEYGGFESQKDMFFLEDTTSLATIEKVIAYFSEGNKSDFDKGLQNLVGFNNDHLYMLMGRRAMDEANYAKAAEAFGKVSPSIWEGDEWKYFDEDPFYISTKYDADKKNLKDTPYSFAKKMAELEAKLKANPNDAESAYLLGCGTYNTTHKGNSWILRRRSWSSEAVNNYSKINYELDYFQANKAKEFFIEASKSSNQELAAKACFGAAICERDAFQTLVAQQEYNPDETPEVFQARLEKLRASKYSEYFKILYSKYQNTKYQKQVLEECGDYSLFNGGK